MPTPSHQSLRPKLRVLVIDDTQEEYVWIGQALDRLPSVDITHQWVPNPFEANELHEQNPFDAILIDYHLDGLTGTEAIELFNYGLRSLPIIMMTSSGGFEASLHGLEKGVSLFLDKNEFKPSLIERVLLYSIRQKELENRLSNFSAYVAHDISAPLRSMSTFVDMLLANFGDTISESERSIAEGILEQTTQSQNLVTDLLEYSVCNNKRMQKEEHSFDQLIQQALSSLNAAIEENDASVSVKAQHESIVCDSNLIVHVLINLIQNALKYRSESPPQININYSLYDEWQLVSVADNGIGMEPSNTKKIFEPLFRIHNAKCQTSGTGIGLAIVKDVIERHGGIIWVDSQPGEGSTFHFRLPKSA
ncbi:ATP-binding protein [Pelagicoccus sp. SDUM812005]|uniref:sensor histidine kinase n=1 Tax=Pelagicoccus sp. SDUM812005 TaxID=3041257 RepID=UPI0028100D0C|nr:ATP-binding protein [Pelagicoccus sp. SDUM812005]MDQ8179713.1 ATP-binding protein [Pelagicoccus sp. SDUM812005]